MQVEITITNFGKLIILSLIKREKIKLIQKNNFIFVKYNNKIKKTTWLILLYQSMQKLKISRFI